MTKLQKRLQKALDSREFYELIQQYRTAPVVDQDWVIRAFEAVKRFVMERAI